MKLRGGEAPLSSEQLVRQAPDWEMAYRDLDVTEREDREYLAGVVAMGQANSTKFWQWYEKIGEVRYALNRSARVAGYARFYAERIDEKGNIGRTHEDSPTVQGILNGITSRFGGVRGLVQRYYMLMKVPGEGLFVRFVSDTPDGYWFLSPDEISRESLMSDMKTLTEPLTWKTARPATSFDQSSDPFTLKVKPEDVLGRVWTPSYRFVDECDSPMQAVEPLCEILDELTRTIRSRIRSRFAMNGMILVPSGINEAGIASKMPEKLLYSSNKVLNAIIHIMSVNMARTGNAIDRLPMAVMGPADELDKIKHLIFDSKIDEVDLKLRVELIGRILDGLDQQKSATRDGEGQSHWGAWATEETERRITVEPDLQQLDHVLTRMVLWRELKALEWAPARITPWRIRHNLDEASVRINQAEDWRQAFDRQAIGPDALRRASGAKSTDAPTGAELVRMFGHKNANPIFAFYGLEGIEAVDMDKALLWGKSSKSGPNADSEGDDSPEGPGVSDPGSPNDRDSDAPKAEEPR